MQAEHGSSPLQRIYEEQRPVSAAVAEGCRKHLDRQVFQNTSLPTLGARSPAITLCALRTFLFRQKSQAFRP